MFHIIPDEWSESECCQKSFLIFNAMQYHFIHMIWFHKFFISKSFFYNWKLCPAHLISVIAPRLQLQIHTNICAWLIQSVKFFMRVCSSKAIIFHRWRCVEQFIPAIFDYVPMHYCYKYQTLWNCGIAMWKYAVNEQDMWLVCEECTDNRTCQKKKLRLVECEATLEKSFNRE